MTREEKNQVIEDIAVNLRDNNVIYLADVSEMDAEASSKLRRLCFSKNVSLKVVKNTLLKKAMERVEGKNFDELYPVLKGNTSLMIAEVANAPAKLIKEFRKKDEKPLLKGAYVEEAVYIGDDSLETLSALKSKEELIADVILLLQSPTKTVVSQLKSAGGKLAGILQTLSEKES